jgi:hypothetical protein
MRLLMMVHYRCHGSKCIVSIKFIVRSQPILIELSKAKRQTTQDVLHFAFTSVLLVPLSPFISTFHDHVVGGSNSKLTGLISPLRSVICGGSVSENVTVGHKVPQMTSYSHNQSRTLESKRSQSSWRAFCILYHWFWYALLPPLSRNMIVKISWLFYYSPKQTYAKLKMTNLWSSLTVSFDLFSRTPNSQLS